MIIEIGDKFLKTLIGLTVDEAKELCKKQRITQFRVTKKDGVNFFVTMDLKFNRINFHVENELIVDCYVG